MKIAHVVCVFPPYKAGMGNSVYFSALQMGKLGHESVVFTPAYDDDRQGIEKLGDKITVVRLRPWLIMGNAAVLPQLLWKLRGFDVVHLHYPFFGSSDVVMAAVLLSKAKLIVHYHMDALGSGFKGFLFRSYSFFMLPLIVRLARLITCASLDYVKHSDLGAYYENHQQKFVQVPFGVDTERFSPLPRSDVPTALFVGGLDSQHYFKGVDILIEAFASIVSKIPAARLTIVGKGNLEDYYLQRIRTAGLEGKARILNSISDEELVQLYRQAWVAVLPSINKGEAFGMVLQEAMASGTPVIASNLPGVRSVFRNGEHGCLVKPGDCDDLAEKLLWFLDDRDRVEDMGAHARDWVKKSFSWEKFNQRLEAAYCRVLYTPEEVQRLHNGRKASAKDD